MWHCGIQKTENRDLPAFMKSHSYPVVSMRRQASNKKKREQELELETLNVTVFNEELKESTPVTFVFSNVSLRFTQF